MALVILALLVGCSSPPEVDLSMRLPEGHTLLISYETEATTRTPMGIEGVSLQSVQRWRIVEGGEVGTDDIVWDESYTSYEVARATPQGEVRWSLASGEEVPAALQGLEADGPSRVTLAANGELSVQAIPVPPTPDRAEVERRRRRGEPEPEPEPAPEPPPPRPVHISHVENWLGGLTQMPSEPIKPGEEWSWELSQQVTRSGKVKRSVTWRFDRLQGTTAVLAETQHLGSSMAPSHGEFRTSALDGSGELRLDTKTGLPLRYTSNVDALLASPSAQGTFVLSTDVAFKIRESRPDDDPRYVPPDPTAEDE